jgi:hypothetical protein
MMMGERCWENMPENDAVVSFANRMPQAHILSATQTAPPAPGGHNQDAHHADCNHTFSNPGPEGDNAVAAMANDKMISIIRMTIFEKIPAQWDRDDRSMTARSHTVKSTSGLINQLPITAPSTVNSTSGHFAASAPLVESCHA